MNNVFSFSKIGTYKTCPYSYYLTYIQHVKRENGVYGILGSYVHEMLESLEHGKMTNEEAVKKWKEQIDLMEFMDELKFPTEKSKHSYIEDITLYLKNFKPIDIGDKEFAVEEHFKIKISDFILQGYIDLYIIDNKKKEIQIVDYKTSSKSGFTKSHLLEKCYQLILYSIALEEKYPEYKIVNTSFDMIKYAKHKKTGKVKERKNIPPEDELDYERYFISIPYNKENKQKFIEYLNTNVNEIYDILNNDKPWKPNKKNTFYCSNLCSVSKNCKFYKSLNK